MLAIKISRRFKRKQSKFKIVKILTNETILFTKNKKRNQPLADIIIKYT